VSHNNLMRIFFTKVWVKVRLTVIIILSITIGASYAIAIPQYLQVRKEADKTWEMVQSIQEQRKENKKKDDVSLVNQSEEVSDPVRQEEVAAPEMASPPCSFVDRCSNAGIKTIGEFMRNPIRKI